MKVIVNKSNVIQFITKEAEIVDNGIQTEEFLIGIQGLTIHDVAQVPSYVKVQKYCYDVSSFSENLDYKNVIDPITEIQRLTDENIRLKAQVELQDSAIMDLANIVSELSGGVA